MPGINIFPDLKANVYEARSGLLYYPKTGYFKIDIGDARDILKYSSAASSEYSFGSEFFVHALGLNIKTKRLPIDAAEGYFGIHFSYSDSSKSLKARLRVLHNSSHLVDGHLERGSTYSSSIDYVKDYAELTILRSFKIGRNNLDCYLGAAYAIVIHPHNLKKFTGNAGMQMSVYKIADSLFERPVDLFWAYNFNLSSIPAYIGNSHFTTGVRFGNWDAAALTLYLSYYIGTSLFNQYYNKRVNEFSIGFYID